jgi:arsenate reductase
MNQFVTVMKALSDPNRVKIIKMLQHRPMCVCEIHTALSMAQPAVSKHLKVLENAGFVIGRKSGLWVNYSLSNGAGSPYAAMLLGALKHWLQDDSEIMALISRLPQIHHQNISKNKATRIKTLHTASDVGSPLQQPSDTDENSNRNQKQKLKILFLCTGNTCRSQIAEGLTRHLKSDVIEPWSAGIDPGTVNPLAILSMAEIGIDISAYQSKSIESLGPIDFDYVITLCDHANESCPLFPGKTNRLHFGFDDPPSLAKNAQNIEEAIVHYRRVRDEIREMVMNLPGILNN